MDIKKYFDEELKSTLIHSAVAIIAGYISFVINQPVLSFFVMLAVLLGTTFAARALLKVQKGFKWWLGNGVIVFIFVWLITWTIFYNTRLY
jgi:hypothetical protein